MSGTRSASPRARATEAALVVCGHGARGASRAAAAHAAALAGRGGFAEAHACALFGQPRLEEVLAGLAGRAVVLVPYLLAEGYTLGVLARRLGAADPAGRVRLARPLGAHPGIAGVAGDMAAAAGRARGWRPAETALLLVGHGTPREATSGETARRHAATLAAAGRFAEVATAFLDEPPSVPAALAALRATACVAVGLFAEAGAHGEVDVPALLAEGRRPAAYAGPLGPAPAVAELVLQQAMAAQVPAAAAS